MDLQKYFAKENKTIAEHTQDLIDRADFLYNLGYIKNEYIYNLLKKACHYHDYGKVNVEFQNRLITRKNFDKEKELSHNILSVFFIDKEQFANKKEYYIVANAVLNHHDYCDNNQIIQEDEYTVLIDQLLSEFETYTIKNREKKQICHMTNNEDTFIVKGLLHRCDYAASANIAIEYKNDFLEAGLSNLGYTLNNLQRFCIENNDKNIIAIAQTGMGKTEAGLYWIGNHKGFFILPLRSAINAIYDRIKTDVLKNENIDERLALLHGDMLSYYEENSSTEMNVFEYYNKSKKLSIPLNISTLDQLFTFVFQFRGFELLLATLSYSKIVIDEIQMYSPDLLAYLMYGIKMIAKHGGKVAILTATLAPFVRDLIQKQDIGDIAENIFIDESIRHNLKVMGTELCAEDIEKKYQQNKTSHESNKILVVCNTVKKAQEIYKNLSEIGNIENINLLHSKYIRCERAEKENQLIADGETYMKGTEIINKKNVIWICTQVVEASLDIDFDYLFTELSDINGLFQRLGRCNRKGVKSIEDYNCYVYTKINAKTIKNGERGFIDKKIHELSINALIGIEGKLSESKKLKIINENLTTDNLLDSDYLKEYEYYYDKVNTPYIGELSKKEAIVEFRNIISYEVIPEHIYDEKKGEIEEALKIIESAVDVRNKMKAKELIKALTLSVAPYELYSKFGNSVKNKILIGKYEEISVLSCEYNELGFVRSSHQKEDDIQNIW